MIKHTKTQVQQYLREALDFNSDIESQADHLINELGITVDDERPEPGSVHVTDDGHAAIMGVFGTLHTFSPDGQHIPFSPPSNWPNLEPARIVSEADWSAMFNGINEAILERDRWKTEVRSTHRSIYCD